MNEGTDLKGMVSRGKKVKVETYTELRVAPVLISVTPEHGYPGDREPM